MMKYVKCLKEAAARMQRHCVVCLCYTSLHAADLFALSSCFFRVVPESIASMADGGETARSYASQWLSVDVVKTFAVARGGRATMKPIRR
jgi:hypothetical protein